MLTHIARNADSVVWRLEGAARGELRDQYPGGLEQRQGRHRGRGRPPGGRRWSLDVRRTSAGVERAMADLPAAAWDAPSRTSRGVVESSRDAVLSRWREVVVHHGDLGLAPVPFPPELVDAWLPRELPRLAERTRPRRVAGLDHRPGRPARAGALVAPTASAGRDERVARAVHRDAVGGRRARDARQRVAVVDQGAGTPGGAVPAEDPPDGVDGPAERRGGARDAGQARGVGAGEGRLGGDGSRGARSRRRSRSGRRRCCRR